MAGTSLGDVPADGMRLAGKENGMMRLDELKKGLWGYKKEDVYRYIVGMEEESSRKLAEKDAKLTEKDTRMAQQEDRKSVV